MGGKERVDTSTIYWCTKKNTQCLTVNFLKLGSGVVNYTVGDSKRFFSLFHVFQQIFTEPNVVQCICDTTTFEAVSIINRWVDGTATCNSTQGQQSI